MTTYTWTHNKGARCRFSDPIDIVFRNVSSLSVLENAWVNTLNPLNNQRWQKSNETQQYLQGCTDANEISIVCGSRFTRRYHVRLWDKTTFDTTVVGAAHYEKWAVTTHHVLSFEDAENAVCRTFSGLANWQVRQDTQDHRNAIDSPLNNGRLSIIER